jgi:hypothetical protein
MPARYLLIAFDADKPKQPSYSKRKYVKKTEFEAILSDPVSQVDLDEVTYDIIEKRCFSAHCSMCDNTYFLIIDVKKPSPLVNVE